MKKVSEFLEELNSHTVYAEPQTANRFKEETGQTAPWSTSTVGSINCTLGDIKGLQEEIKGNESNRVSEGHEIAVSCAEKYTVKYGSFLNGRGSQFRHAIMVLKAAGL